MEKTPRKITSEETDFMFKEVPRVVLSEETLKEFTYRQNVMYRLVKVEYGKDFEVKTGKKFMHFEPVVSDLELEDELREMSLEHKLNLPKYAKPVFVAVKLLDLDIKEYITNAEIVTYVVNNGLKSQKKLKENNPFVYDLAVERGLIRKIFPKLRESAAYVPEFDDLVNLLGN